MAISDSAILKKNPDIAVRTVGEQTILLPVYKSSGDINCLYSLNESAARVWELLDGKRTLGDIKQALLAEFEVTPAALDREMKGLLADFQEMKAVTIKQGGRTK